MVYEIAGHRIRVFTDSRYNLAALLHSYNPFRVEDDGGEMLVDLAVCTHIKAIPESDCILIRDVDTGNGIIKVMQITGQNPDGNLCHENLCGGYQFVIFDIKGNPCALLITDSRFHECFCGLNSKGNNLAFGINTVIMLCYSFATAPYDTVIIHASLVRHRGKAYAFTAKSGTGKSTQTANWLRYIPDCDLMNDDNPVIRVIDGDVFIFGSPWSGKTPCYRNVKALLGGIAEICRDDRNFLCPIRPIKAFVLFTSSCSSMKWDERIRSANYDTITKVLNNIPYYELHCLPDRDSAIVASEGMIREKR